VSDLYSSGQEKSLEYDNITFWRSVAEQAADAILAIDFAGRIYYANNSASRIYGYSQDELRGMPLEVLRAPETLDEYPGQFEQAKQTGILFRTRHRRKDGQVFPVEVNSRCVEIPDGKIILSVIHDVSVNEQLAEEARVTHLFADTLIRAASFIIVVTDHQGSIRLFNEAAQNVTGYTVEEAVGRLFFELLIEPADREAICEHFFSTLKPGYLGAYENTIITKSGERRVISWQNCAIADSQGFISILGFGLDITDCLETQANLRRKDSFIHGVVQGLMFPFYVLDRNYCYLAYNDAHKYFMKNLLNADIELGKNFLSYSNSPTLTLQARHNINCALAGKPCIVEVQLSDDPVYVALIEHNPVRDGNGDIIGVAVVTHEIGALRSAEAALQASNQRYRSLVENAPTAILVVGSQGEVQYINPFGATVFGYAPEDLIGQSVEGTILPEYETTGRNLWAILRDIWDGPERELHITNENITRRGQRLWMDWSIRKGCSPLTGSEGWLCMGVDVTAKHRAMERQMKHRRQNDIMNDIISGRVPEEKAIDFLQSAGVDVKKNLQCIVISRPPETIQGGKSGQHRKERQQLAEQCRMITQGIVWETKDSTGILMQCRESDSEYHLAELAQSVSALWQKMNQHGCAKQQSRVGVAFKLYPDIGIRQLYHQAYSAAEFGQCLASGRELYFWHELGWIRLLVQNIHTEETKRYVQERLGKLINMADGEKRETLLDTMKKVLAGTPVDAMAAQLCVHKQTIRYRVRIIEKMLGEDSFKGENAVNLAIALKLHEMQRKVQGETVGKQ
jgi:PAS domain S-box-containing protein